jgi:hypothetical protein
MSVSVNILFTVKITPDDFVGFVREQGGFISNEKEINGGFNSNGASVWFYNLATELNPVDESNKTYLSEVKAYLAVPASCYIYFELSSRKYSYALMLQIAYKLSKVWPIFVDCCVQDIFTYEKISEEILFQSYNTILGKSFSFFFSDNPEKSIIDFMDENFSVRSIIAVGNKEDFLLDEEDILGCISISDLDVYFSVVYEYEHQEWGFTNLVEQQLDTTPGYFCEIVFGDRLDHSHNKALLMLIANFQQHTKSVGLGLFRKVLQRKDLEEMMIQGNVTFV